MEEMHFGYFDGASRGNPGPAAAAARLENGEGITMWEDARFLGTRTNNEAEYDALLLLLEEASRRGVRKLVVRGDSKLVVEQMRGAWKIREQRLQGLAAFAKMLLEDCNASFEWIPRERNARADELANVALDAGLSGKAPMPKEAWRVVQKVGKIIIVEEGGETFAADLAHGACTCPDFRSRGACRHLDAKQS